MTIKELQKIHETMFELYEFASANSLADESGIADDMNKLYQDSMRIIENEKYKLYLRNAKVKAVRNLKVK
jgi:hypothetical protein